MPIVRKRQMAAVLAGTAILAAACASSPSTNSASGGSSSQGSSGTSSGDAYAACMRSHGEPRFPNPNSQGAFKYKPGSGINPGSPQFQSASQACQHLITGGGADSAGPGASAQQQFVKYAACMRSHGVSGFSASTGSNGSIQVNPSAINPNSQTFQSAQAACQSLMPGGGAGYGL